MNARLVNQALALVVRECCPAELLHQLHAQAEQIQAQSKQIRAMLQAIQTLEVGRAHCCRVCFVVVYNGCFPSDRLCYCSRCGKQICRGCESFCAGCRRCPECASKSGH